MSRAEALSKAKGQSKRLFSPTCRTVEGLPRNDRMLRLFACRYPAVSCRVLHFGSSLFTSLSVSSYILRLGPTAIISIIFDTERYTIRKLLIRKLLIPSSPPRSAFPHEGFSIISDKAKRTFCLRSGCMCRIKSRVSSEIFSLRVEGIRTQGKRFRL